MRALLSFSIATLLGLTPAVAVAQELLAKPSFEMGEAVCGYPADFGDWAVDFSEIVSAQAGVTPFDGSQMLRLDSVGFFEVGPAFLGASGGAPVDVAQLVDLSSCHSAGTNARLRFSAYFNRSSNGGVSQYSCLLRAFDGVPAAFSSAATVPLTDVTTVVPIETSTA
jgi:hypothetical protein